jgi:hypothetical protein
LGAGRTPEDFSRHIKRLTENNQRDTHLSKGRGAEAGRPRQSKPSPGRNLDCFLHRGQARGGAGDEARGHRADFITIHASNTKTLKTRLASVT